MESGSTWQLIVFVILLMLSAFFSASEMALMTLSKIRIRQMVDEGVKGADVVDKLIQNPNKLLSTILVGNNVVNIAASALATSLSISYFGNGGVGIATGIVTVLVLIFGEIVPKSLASKNSEKISLAVAKAIYFVSVILTPVTKIFSFVTNFILKLLGNEPDDKPSITEDEIKTMVDVSHEEGVLEIGEREMIKNVFEFNDTLIKDVMIQRTDIVAIEKSLSYDETMKVFKEEQFSRMPVYDKTRDNIIGILNVKDLLFVENTNDFKIEKHMRESFFTFEFKKIDELFSEMKKKRIPIAIVMNEYGGTSGLVTIEDLVEEIVGEIEDEYDEITNEIVVIKEDEYIISGVSRIDLVNEMIGTNIEAEGVDTLGGFIIGHLGRLPKQGETVETNDIKFIIQDVDEKRIKKIKVLT